MRTTLFLLGVFLFSTGCQTTYERQSLRPLPEDGPPVPYAELLTRARHQAGIATEAFYVDKWAELQVAAKGLEQTARYLAKAGDVPPAQKDKLPGISEELGKEAKGLLTASESKNVDEVTDILGRINRKVRELRLDQ